MSALCYPVCRARSERLWRYSSSRPWLRFRTTWWGFVSSTCRMTWLHGTLGPSLLWGSSQGSEICLSSVGDRDVQPGLGATAMVAKGLRARIPRVRAWEVSREICKQTNIREPLRENKVRNLTPPWLLLKLSLLLPNLFTFSQFPTKWE